jgi:hypothetical protein
MPPQGVLPKQRVLTSSAVRDGFDYKFWVYILISRTSTLYIGITAILIGASCIFISL